MLMKKRRSAAAFFYPVDGIVSKHPSLLESRIYQKVKKSDLQQSLFPQLFHAGNTHLCLRHEKYSANGNGFSALYTEPEIKIFKMRQGPFELC